MCHSPHVDRGSGDSFLARTRVHKISEDTTEQALLLYVEIFILNPHHFLIFYIL